MPTRRAYDLELHYHSCVQCKALEGDGVKRPLSPEVPPGLRVRVACPLGIGRSPAKGDRAFLPLSPEVPPCVACVAKWI